MCIAVDKFGKVTRWLCGDVLKTRQALYQHGIKTKKHGAFTCSLCVASFASDSALQTHLKSCRDSGVQRRCVFCFFPFDGQTMEMHIAEKHAAEVAKITAFRKTQAALSSSESAKRRPEGAARYPFMCGDCKAVFKTRFTMRKHQDGHGVQRAACRFLPHEDNVCPKCGRGFEFKWWLKYHKNSGDCRVEVPDGVVEAPEEIEFTH